MRISDWSSDVCSSDLQLRRLVRHVDALALRIAEEGFALLLLILQRTQLVGHAPLRDHVAGKLGGVLDVARRAAGHLVVTEDDSLLGRTSCRERVGKYV